MATTVDARGLSCPQPVILVLNEIKKGKDKDIIILVDTDTSKENVSSAAENQGCKTNEILSESSGFKISITKA
ncbi:MAG: sulfurtransferase TusA family protein [Spirochaetota bacterium]